MSHDLITVRRTDGTEAHIYLKSRDVTATIEGYPPTVRSIPVPQTHSHEFEAVCSQAAQTVLHDRRERDLPTLDHTNEVERATTETWWHPLPATPRRKAKIEALRRHLQDEYEEDEKCIPGCIVVDKKKKRKHAHMRSTAGTAPAAAKSKSTDPASDAR